jgi:hypothetical protein
MDNIDTFFPDMHPKQKAALRLAIALNNHIEMWLDCDGPASFELNGDDYLLDHGTSGRYMVWLDGEVIAYSEDERNFRKCGEFVFNGE